MEKNQKCIFYNICLLQLNNKEINKKKIHPFLNFKNNLFTQRHHKNEKISHWVEIIETRITENSGIQNI